jgi:hypothetical protein
MISTILTSVILITFPIRNSPLYEGENLRGGFNLMSFLCFKTLIQFFTYYLSRL